jgi:2-polyprenyl-3-methyl-5-hydroxy-6-metoxy-1,4-benzoquinol methylase
LRKCWCNNSSSNLSRFNDEYLSCQACQTIISQASHGDDKFLVNDDETDFYGKQYWLSHQSQDLGFVDIHGRTRSDLSDRNLYWLKTLLKYKLPSSKILELGCSHGSFVALMRQTGFDACGVEMSPWVVDYASKTFDVPISLGPVEQIESQYGHFDAIVLMDVLEHLPNPMMTMSHCLKLLKPDGFLLVQTPQFKPEMVYDELLASKSRFLEMLIKDEHLYLFSEESVTKLFQNLGVNYIQFEPAIFAHYDMFFAVSRVPFKFNTTEQIESKLLSDPKSRFTLAMLDLKESEGQLSQRLNEYEQDRFQQGNQANTMKLIMNTLFARRSFRFLNKYIVRLLNKYVDWSEFKELEREQSSND